MLKEARRCREELEHAKEHLKLAQVAENKAHDHTKTAMDGASKFEADYVSKVGVGGMRLIC